MTSERDVRDRLAEALYDNFAHELFTWPDAPPTRRRKWQRISARILKSLPSVGLIISTDPQDDGGRG